MSTKYFGKIDPHMEEVYFVAVKNTIFAVNRPEFDSDVEVVWTSIEFAKNGTVHIGSYYRPPDSKIIALDHLQDSLNKILSKHKNLPTIVLAGDCNFPDINWENTSSTKTSTQAWHTLFLNLLNENGLTQMTRDITRLESNTILDLVMTTNPDLVNNVQVKPGVSENVALLNIN